MIENDAVASFPIHCRFQAVDRGFTLLELMMAVAVLILLTTISVPLYLDYAKRGRLLEAFNTMSSYALALEQFYQDNRTYVGGCTSRPPTSGNFSYACTLSGNGYMLTATGSSSTVSGFVFTLDQTGAHATTAAPSGWTANPGCWISNKSGQCQIY